MGLKTFSRILHELFRLPARLMTGLITIYQKTISPDHSWLLRGRYPYGFCRFYPSCSEYAKQAIASHGLVAGGAKALKRIARCNPWTVPSIDLNR